MDSNFLQSEQPSSTRLNTPVTEGESNTDPNRNSIWDHLPTEYQDSFRNAIENVHAGNETGMINIMLQMMQDVATNARIANAQDAERQAAGAELQALQQQLAALREQVSNLANVRTVPPPIPTTTTGNVEVQPDVHEARRAAVPGHPVLSAAASTLDEHGLRYRKVGDLEQIPKYDGQRKNDAAEKWLRKCRRYFNDEREMAGLYATDKQKIITASRKLVVTAELQWTVQEDLARDRPELAITTWEGFERWIRERFTLFSKDEDHWAKYRNAKQGKFDFQTYALYVMDVATLLDTDEPIPEKLLERQIFEGTNPELKELWAREWNMPERLIDKIQRVSQLEQSRKLGNRFQAQLRSATTMEGGDVMDLSTLKGTTQPKKSDPNFRTWCRQNGACFGCGRKNTRKPDCPKCSKKENNDKKGKAKESTSVTSSGNGNDS